MDERLRSAGWASLFCAVRSPEPGGPLAEPASWTWAAGPRKTL